MPSVSAISATAAALAWSVPGSASRCHSHAPCPLVLIAKLRIARPFSIQPSRGQSFDVCPRRQVLRPHFSDLSAWREFGMTRFLRSGKTVRGDFVIDSDMACLTDAANPVLTSSSFDPCFIGL